MKCDDVRLRFDDYLCGETDADTGDQIAAHLVACPDCYETLLSVSDAGLDLALAGDWYLAEPSPGFAEKVMPAARLRFYGAKAAWLVPLWLMYAAAIAASGLWLAIGRTILGVSLSEAIGFARSTTSVMQTLIEAFSLLRVNEPAVFLLALSCLTVLMAIRYTFREVLL